MNLRVVTGALVAVVSAQVSCAPGEGTSDGDGGAVGAVPFTITMQCPTTVTEGLDVYKGQGTIDWAQVKASGRDFAFIKATQGTYNIQTTFVADWAGARAAGVLRSAYHFFDPTDDGNAQATAFLTELAAGGGMDDDDLPPLVDIECPTSSVSADADPNCEGPGASGYVATATMISRIDDFLAAVEAATARKPIVYSYPSWFGDVKFTDASLAAYPLFIASYATCASVPSPWTAATFWQYSATATVPGIAGTKNVDIDRYFGSDGDLVAWNKMTNERDAGVDAGIAMGDGGEPTGDGGVNGDGGSGRPGHNHAGCSAGAGDGSGGAAGTAAVMVAVVGAAIARRRAVLRG